MKNSKGLERRECILVCTQMYTGVHTDDARTAVAVKVRNRWAFAPAFLCAHDARRDPLLEAVCVCVCVCVCAHTQSAHTQSAHKQSQQTHTPTHPHTHAHITCLDVCQLFTRHPPVAVYSAGAWSQLKGRRGPRDADATPKGAGVDADSASAPRQGPRDAHPISPTPGKGNRTSRTHARARTHTLSLPDGPKGTGACACTHTQTCTHVRVIQPPCTQRMRRVQALTGLRMDTGTTASLT